MIEKGQNVNANLAALSLCPLNILFYFCVGHSFRRPQNEIHSIEISLSSI